MVGFRGLCFGAFVFRLCFWGSLRYACEGELTKTVGTKPQLCSQRFKPEVETLQLLTGQASRVLKARSTRANPYKHPVFAV